MLNKRTINTSLTTLPDQEEPFTLVIQADLPSVRPVECMSIDQLECISKPIPKTTFHQTHKMLERKSEKTFFLKENPPDSPVSELEAVAASFYKLLAFDYIPRTHAVVDEKNTYIGVISEEFSGFISTAEDPLREEDLQTDFIQTKKLSFEALDTLEPQYVELEKTKTLLQEKLKNVIADSIEEKKLNAEKSIITNLQSRLLASLSITEKEFSNYRIVKGLAIALTTSYIFMEADLHQNNLSKYGKRIDFDMSLWRILYDFKEDKFIILRKPNESTFKITAEDILNFPHIKHPPFYWPTKYAGVVSDTITAMMSTNAYSHATSLLYQKLATNPVFMHYKFAIFAKYVLTHADIYRTLALRHMREGYIHRAKMLVECVAKEQAERIAEFSNVLLSIPAFATLLKQHHQKLIDELFVNATKLGTTFDTAKVEQVRDYLLKYINNISIATPSVSSSSSSLFKKVPLIAAETVEKLKKIVTTSMNTYINPGLFSVHGYFRNHTAIATRLILYCNKLKPHLTNKEFNTKLIMDLKNEILKELKPLSSGRAMYDHLTALVTEIQKELPVDILPAETKDIPQLAKSSSKQE